ncbi:DUF155-domain-containing protein [Piedraia hortae CBS 480.64]|uniref:DUF155-domain-containing protein n=1 Tax=Piedraia hortae CBS 480.64 TaxID=1314780 RepID=A0A6A7C5T9_9PEZI|nr:DUF155-domain-containing protein [Piedraia hortae CBS 480.64]
MPSESTPLLPTDQQSLKQPVLARANRSVTFNPKVSAVSPPKRDRPGVGEVPREGHTTLSALNSKLRRRNSSGAPLQYNPQNAANKIGPQRTTRTAQKLKLLPNPDVSEEGAETERGGDVYSQFERIKDPTARRDAARLGKDDRAKLPRVTAYCTAGDYQMNDLMRYLKSKTRSRSAAPKRFDECIYTPYSYSLEGERRSGEPSTGETEVQSHSVRRFSDSRLVVEENAERRRDTLLDMQQTEGESITPAEETAVVDEEPVRPMTPDFDTVVHIPEVFLFEYGVVVIWGMSVREEKRFLKELSKFESEKLDDDNIQTEEFNFYYTREYQARIYNDFISLREKRNYMTKLAISHALAQSTKTSLYEVLLTASIDTTKNIPATISRTGRINLSRRQINMQIGELFILRINIHLQGSVLDAPELMWAEPQLEPIYQAVRSYLEMDQRVELMQERVSVVGDLLAVLKDQLSHTHGEYLEWIVIVLIAVEILVAAINIVVDLYAGVE